MLNYWLHRISHLAYISYPLLDSGFLSIGFSDMSSVGFLKRVTDLGGLGWDYFEEEFEKTYHEKSRGRFSLWRFIAEMKKGDCVLVPSWGNFSIYEIEEDSSVLPSSFHIAEGFRSWDERKISLDTNGKFVVVGDEHPVPVDIGFLRKVKLVQKDIPRDGYADSALTRRMKIRDTNALISDLEDSIKCSLDAKSKGKPISLKSSLIDTSIDIWLKQIKKLSDDVKFEKLVGKYLKRVGATLIDPPPKNLKNKIGDVDVIGAFESIRTIVNVQVKRHDGETSNEAVQQITEYAASKRGNSDDGYSRVYWVVSSADLFSEEAKKVAIQNDVLLFNGREFVRMLMEAGIENIGDDE